MTEPMKKEPNSRNAFELMGGEVRLWIEQESIHMLACDINYRDPVELTAQHARELASKLLELADLAES